MVTPGSRVADVGCDHAHTSIWLVKNGIASSCIAMDLREGPLKHAKENIIAYKCEKSIETRLSDGLEALRPGEADTILITGMGGGLMTRILEAGRETVAKASELILQPQSDINEVRAAMLEFGFGITEEACCMEYGKFYLSLHGIAGRKAFEAPFSESEIAYGRYLADKGDSVYHEHLKHEYRKVQKILERLKNGGSADVSERVFAFEKEEGFLRETLEKFEKRRS